MYTRVQCLNKNLKQIFKNGLCIAFYAFFDTIGAPKKQIK